MSRGDACALGFGDLRLEMRWSVCHLDSKIFVNDDVGVDWDVGINGDGDLQDPNSGLRHNDGDARSTARSEVGPQSQAHRGHGQGEAETGRVGNTHC